MPIISNNVQNLWKDSYASSQSVNLTLRANGEEEVSLITPQGTMVRAGIDAPTAVPTCAAGAATGTMTQSRWVSYRYVYASSRYPGVENTITGEVGELWPRGNPSGRSAAFQVTATRRVNVTCTRTTQPGVDRIWLYRTLEKNTQAEAEADADAGLMFYAGTADNTGIAGTVTIIDSSATLGTEQLETDNFMAPLFQYTVFDGNYWWGWGNSELVVEVTLNNTSGISLVSSSDKWFSGRSGQIVTFDGITEGGFDGRGSFYIGIDTNNTATLYDDIELTDDMAVAASGTTMARIKGYQTTLYRSKKRNPFSWGWTEDQVADDGTVTQVPQTWAYREGGGRGVAMALVPNESVLVLHAEEPTKTYRYNLNNADTPLSLGSTRQVLDEQRSIGSHFTQFVGVTQNGFPQLYGVDAKSFSILQTTADYQSLQSSDVFETLRDMQQIEREAFLWHGVYDHRTELNCFWIKRFDDDTTSWTHNVDTLVYRHAPTGQWGKCFDPEISASASVYDPRTRETITLVGTENGKIGQAFCEDQYRRFYTENQWPGVYAVASATSSTVTFTISEVSYGVIATIGAGNPALVTLEEVTEIPDDEPVFIYNASVNGEYNIDVVDSSSFYIDGLVSTATTGGFVLPAGLVNNWHLIISPDGQTAYYFKTNDITSFADMSVPLSIPVGVDFVVDAITGDFLGLVFPTVPDSTWKLVVGGKYVAARTYFDLQTPDKAKKMEELWTSLQNVDANVPSTIAGTSYNGWVFARHFNEFSETVSSTFRLFQDTQPDSSGSVNWLSKTAVPSTLLNQFGFEICEVGQDAFRIMNLTLKGRTLDAR